MSTRARRLAALIGVALALAPVTGAAGEFSGLSLGGTGTRDKLFRSQVKLLDTRLSVQYSHSDRLRPDYAPGSGTIPSYRGRYRGEYMTLARAAAQRYGIPEDLFLRLVQQESGWNHGAVSVKGAKGLAQLMPGTAHRLGVDSTDPRENLDGGARYLRMMYDRFGSWRLALAAYNAGPDAVEKHGGVPPFAETQNYVRSILGS